MSVCSRGEKSSFFFFCLVHSARYHLPSPFRNGFGVNFACVFFSFSVFSVTRQTRTRTVASVGRRSVPGRSVQSGFGPIVRREIAGRVHQGFVVQEQIPGRLRVPGFAGFRQHHQGWWWWRWRWIWGR